ncbi:MAG TPA: ShlB/FhaC/HecB family hemolysin secretion/activation protein [Patescibacteria group bacterium]|nr:ShlB/FhaC/HecB family hemolysin secretion/activation protein [Patescibacteria group bacterium]
MGLILSRVAYAGEQVSLVEPLSPPQPGRDRPGPGLLPPPSLDFTIPAPRRSPVPRAVEELVFDVKDVDLTGATVYSPEQLRALVLPVIGRTVHLSDLIAAAERIEAKYHGDGYVLTRAYVPTQNVGNGVFHIAVVEGFVAAISVQGGDARTRAQVEAMLEPVTQSRPLQVGVLETALLSANELPGSSASGLLRPSAVEPGASDLVVTVKSAPWNSSLSVDNRGSKNTGLWTMAADTSFHSPLDDGGQIGLNASADPLNVNQRRALQVRYGTPVGFVDGMSASISGLVSHGEPAGSVAALSLVTDSVAIGPRLSLPLLLTRAEKLTLDGGVTYQSADVHVLGAPLSHDEWRVADIGLSYQNNVWLAGQSNATLDLAQGVPLFGASKSDSVNLSRESARTDFTKLSSTLHRQQTIVDPLSLSVTVNAQYAFDTLLTGEEVSFGGAQIGRGYDPGSITGDAGLGAASELRYDFNAVKFDLDSLQLYGFYDAGKVWNHVGGIADSMIGSAGAGIRLGAMQSATLGLELAHVLLPVPGNDEGRRSSRVMLNSSVRF